MKELTYWGLLAVIAFAPVMATSCGGGRSVLVVSSETTTADGKGDQSPADAEPDGMSDQLLSNTGPAGVSDLEDSSDMALHDGQPDGQGDLNADEAMSPGDASDLTVPDQHGDLLDAGMLGVDADGDLESDDHLSDAACQGCVDMADLETVDASETTPQAKFPFGAFPAFTNGWWRNFDSAKEIGVRRTMVYVGWSVIEGTKGVYNWQSSTPLDRTVLNAQADGISVDSMTILTQVPAWAACKNPACPTADYPYGECLRP